MERRTVLLGLTIGALAAPVATAAQAPVKISRVGVLLLGTPGRDVSRQAAALREGLRELGWIEGQNMLLELRFAAGKREQLISLAADLVHQKVDVIVAGGTEATGAAREVTTSVPIVMAAVGDPVHAGFVKSLARPGGNVTGMSLQMIEVAGKMLQLVKEMVPKASQVAVISASTPSHDEMFKEAMAAAPRVGIQVRRMLIAGPGDLEKVFAEMSRARVDAVIVQPHPEIDELRLRIGELAQKHRLPSFFRLREYVEAGGLMSYGADLAAVQRRAATYVDKILKGAKPADLPIEQPTKFELVINRKTAKALGLTIPQSVLGRADQVIDQ